MFDSKEKDFLSSDSFALLTYRAIEERPSANSLDGLFTKVMETLTCDEKKEIIADWFAEVRCESPWIRGKKGEEILEGDSLEEVARRTGLSIPEVERLTVDFFDESTTADSLPPYWAECFLTEAIEYVAQLVLDNETT